MHEDVRNTDSQIATLMRAMEESGLLDQAALARVASAAATTGERVDIVAVRLGLATDESVAGLWSQILEMPYLSSDDLIEAEFADQRHAVHDGHGEVHQDDVGLERLGQCDRFFTGRGFTDNDGKSQHSLQRFAKL